MDIYIISQVTYFAYEANMLISLHEARHHPPQREVAEGRRVLTDAACVCERPPLDGRANQAAIALAEYFKVKKSAITLLSAINRKQAV